jgi:hypothetical protein
MGVFNFYNNIVTILKKRFNLNFFRTRYNDSIRTKSWKAPFLSDESGKEKNMVTVVTNEDDFCDKATQLLAVFARDNKDNLARIHTKAVETFGIIGLSFYLEEYYHLLCSWGIQSSVTMKVIKASIEDISV